MKASSSIAPDIESCQTAQYANPIAPFGSAVSGNIRKFKIAPELQRGSQSRTLCVVSYLQKTSERHG
jgi:hypothetical protein